MRDSEAHQPARVPSQLVTDGAGSGGELETGPEPLLVVSNRQPYRHEYDDDGSIAVDEPAGGLTAGLDPVVQETAGTWIAWGDGDADFDVTDADHCVRVPPEEPAYTLRRIDLSEDAVDGFYNGFSNRVLWPCCHEFPSLICDRGQDYEWYRTVNEQFATAVLEHADEDATVWFQDYHFALAPRVVADETPVTTTIAQFWHIPWPTPATLAVCPHGPTLLDGLLGNDLLGFHVDRYVTNFLACVEAFCPEATVDYAHRIARYKGTTTQVVSSPMGVDATEYDQQARTADPARAESVLTDHEIDPTTVLGLGLDRLDYSKGIPERLGIIERFFERNPAWCGEFTFFQKATPSRTEIPAYERYGEFVRDEIDRINDRFGTDGWEPIVYTEAYLDQETLSALFRRAEVMIVSSLLDGMNLVAQEYLAGCVDGDGTLLLSDRTGAHEVFGDHALSIDPTDIETSAIQLERALRMSPRDRRQRMHALRRQVFEGDLESWMATQFAWLERVGAAPAGEREQSGEPTRPV